MSHMIKTSPFLPYFTSKTNEISILPMTYVHTASVNRKAAIGKCHTLFYMYRFDACLCSLTSYNAIEPIFNTFYECLMFCLF